MAKKKIIIISIITIILILVVVVTYKFILNKENKIQFEENPISITEYVIFGTHLNISGNINVESYESIQMYFWNSKEEYEISIELTQTDTGYDFTISDYVNGGINLEELSKGEFEVIIKVTQSTTEDNEETLSTKYYYLENNTEYEDLEYYTLTKNNSNNKISITWESTSHLNFVIEETTLPDDVYDIVIDPGHSGVDVGSVGTLNGVEYYERDLNLAIAELLKEELESYGYKVALTRTDNDTKISIYGEDGSATLANQLSAKYNFAIHNNSTDVKNSNSGLELYVVNDLEFSLARLFVDNITSLANTEGSNQTYYQVENGIFRRNFSLSEIESSYQSAIQLGYEPYDITTSTPYYYYLRELGGISTGAYVDGRNTQYDANPYYNSNQTCEPYLFELGYMNSTTDLANLLENKESYAKAIAQSVYEYLNS